VAGSSSWGGGFTWAVGAVEFAALALTPPSGSSGVVLSYDMETFLPNGQMKDLSVQ